MPNIDEELQFNADLQPEPVLGAEAVIPAVAWTDGPLIAADVAAAAMSKKKFVPAKFNMDDYESKTPPPANYPQNLAIVRAKKIPAPDRPNVDGDSQCRSCSCRYRDHNLDKEKNRTCRRCGPGYCLSFVYDEQLNRVYFTEFMRWVRRWIKAGKKRSMARFRQIWQRSNSIARLRYCAGCDTSIFTNDLRSIVSRLEGLSCASCAQCYKCCTCSSCDQCKRRKRKENICQTCKVCDNCCQCAECPVCNRDCSFNYCGYSFTDAMKKNDRGCGRCYKCCDCGTSRKVPFGSFAKPNFHTPTFKHHMVNPTSRYIAAEIECAGIYGDGMDIYNTVRKWGGATVGDGSLNIRGFEVNSAPAGGDLYVNQIEDICASIKAQSGFIDEKCGLHVHVDGRDMNYYDIRRFVRVYAAIEDALFAMVSPQRIEGIVDDKGERHQYCQPCGKKYVAQIEEGRLPYDKIKSDVITSVYSMPTTHIGGINVRYRKRGNHIPRYNALNLHSWFFRGTIEARMYDGTLEANEIVLWGIMWAMIADYVVHSTDEQVAKDMAGKPLACLRKIVGNNNKIIDFIIARVLMFGNEQMKRDLKDSF